MGLLCCLKNTESLISDLRMWMMMASSAVQTMQVERNFPVGVKRGKMTTTDLAQVVIDGKLRLLSPALRIYNEEERNYASRSRMCATLLCFISKMMLVRS